MKKILAVTLTLLLLSGCVSRKPNDVEEISSETETTQEEQDKQDKDTETQPEEDDEKDKPEIVQYKIRETGFGITMEDGWEISALPEPMGIMVMKDGGMQNSGTIQVVYGEEKTQMEKDFEGIFKAMKSDTEIQNYFCDQTEVDGLYRIKLEYEFVDEASGGAVLSRVIYQETTNDGLIIATFQYSQDCKSEAKTITDSISKLVAEDPLEPKQIDQLS